jgi:hypothetical protein
VSFDDAEKHPALEHLGFEVGGVLLPLRRLANAKPWILASLLLGIIGSQRAAHRLIHQGEAMATLMASGADVLVNATTPKFAAQAIKKAAEMGWKPVIHLVTPASISVNGVMKPAGLEASEEVVGANFMRMRATRDGTTIRR